MGRGLDTLALGQPLQGERRYKLTTLQITEMNLTINSVEVRKIKEAYEQLYTY